MSAVPADIFTEAFAEFLRSNTLPRVMPGMSQTEIRKILTNPVPLEEAFATFLQTSAPKTISYAEFLATRDLKPPNLPSLRRANDGADKTQWATWKLNAKK